MSLQISLTPASEPADLNLPWQGHWNQVCFSSEFTRSPWVWCPFPQMFMFLFLSRTLPFSALSHFPSIIMIAPNVLMCAQTWNWLIFKNNGEKKSIWLLWNQTDYERSWELMLFYKNSAAVPHFQYNTGHSGVQCLKIGSHWKSSFVSSLYDIFDTISCTVINWHWRDISDFFHIFSTFVAFFVRCHGNGW